MGGHIARMRETRYKHKIFIAKHEGKMSRGRPRRRCEDNTRMKVREIRWKVANWIHVNRDQWQTLVNTAMNVHVP